MAFMKGSRDFLVALHVVILSASLLSTTLSLSDADVLLRFKSTVIDTRNVLQNWSPTTTPCNGTHKWTGVVCGEGGNVLKLVLQDMGLSGILNVTPLVGLKELKSISFMNNGFEGPMPNVGRFVWMRALYLSGNRLSGKIEGIEFDRMLALSRVHLSRNEFVGTIPESLMGLTRLTELMLEGNKFDGIIPEFRQHGLKANFSNNDLEGPIPITLSNLNPSAFLGNKNLCGPPVSNPCTARSPSPPPQIYVTPPTTPNNGINLLQLIVILAFLSALAVAFLFFLAVQCRQKKDRLDRIHDISRPSRDHMDPESMEPPTRHQSCTDGICLIPGRDVAHRKLVFVRQQTAGIERFEIEELLKSSAEVLGSGSFGSSYKAIMMDGSSVVVKRFREMNAVGKEEFSDHMLRLGGLSHPNLIPLIAYYYRKEEKLLIFDHIPNGSLAHMLHGRHAGKTPKLDWASRLEIVKGVGRGMTYLHSKLQDLDLPHGHLKSSNVILGVSMEAHLSDYALGAVTNTYHASRTMVAFNAPEVAEDGSVTKKADVWSLGIMILEIVSGRFPASSLFGDSVGGTSNMRSWVGSVVEAWQKGESVVDEEMGELSRYEESEVSKLFEIGRGCCEEDVEKRLGLFEAVAKIEEVMEVDLLEEYSSCVSDVTAVDHEISTFSIKK